MAFQTLIADIEHTSGGAVGRLTLNQPDALNPLGADALTEVAEAARWFDTQDVAVVVVTGAGDRAFSSGFDLRQFNDGGPATADLGRVMAEAMEAMRAVTVAAVHGHCIGGGLVLAAVCDLRIAADNTNFAIPEVDLGIPLAWGGIPRLIREIGPAFTRELVMTCRPFDANEAHGLGFVNRVVPRADLDTAVSDMVASLLTKAPGVLATTKRQVQTALEDVASTQGAWADQYALRDALADPAARAAANSYLASKGEK